ncbi:MAG: sigma 54-interacting transcriptional regulator [Deltaproteobacteria bacterium]|nr:sigma 54-interacting transcriptional regulator [Deltaproteobacteria bacterium]
MSNHAHIIPLLTLLSLPAGCGTPTAIDFSLVSDPNVTDLQALLSKVERLELILDAPQGLYPLSAEREITDSLRIKDIDNDGSAELVAEFDVKGRLPLIRVERGGLDADVSVDVMLRGHSAKNQLASGEIRGVSFDEGAIKSLDLLFNTLPAMRAPRVTQTIPANGAQATFAERVQIIFSKRMDAIGLRKPGVVQLLRVTPTGAEEALAASGVLGVRWQPTANGETTTVDFVPLELMSAGTYRIRVSTAAIEDGNPPRPLDQVPAREGDQAFMAQFSVPAEFDPVATPANPPPTECELGGDFCPLGLVCNSTLQACVPETCDCPDPSMVCDPEWMVCMPNCIFAGSEACPPGTHIGKARLPALPCAHGGNVSVESRAIPPGATRILERAEGRVLVVRRGKLEVVKGPALGTSLSLGADVVTIGNDESCDLLLADSSVSGQHFALEPHPKGFLLRDLESTNGTRVNELHVQGVFLPESAVICCGDTHIRFTAADDTVELPLSRRSRLGPLMGHSPAMKAVIAVLERVAKSQATLLIQGESGTGKDVAARAVHQQSARHEAPFVAVDCGAIPASLIESELFGHAKGAFTGATTSRAGPFENATGGTLFLDEIGELPLELQPKLLRVLEERQVQRVGESDLRPFDARVIAATNRNLEREVQEGRFRQDLYFRLSVIKVRMPALRHRKEEIPRLVAHFFAQLGRDPSQTLPDSLLRALESHRWLGNVRELRNVVERIVVLPDMEPGFYLDGGEAPSPTKEDGAEGTDRAEHAATSSVPLDLPFHEGKQRWVEHFEAAYLRAMLQRCEGNISELARASGLSRQSCHRLLKRHGLV